jgi:N-glycosidase YbiA
MEGEPDEAARVSHVEDKRGGRAMSSVIRFYRVKDDYGCFSNFAPYPIDLDGRRWPTSEHYFQAQKFTDGAQRERLRALASPMDAARMGRSSPHPLRADWERVKDDVMRAAVRAKFTQHAKICRVLLGTGDAEIVEHTTNDVYWARREDLRKSGHRITNP